MPYLPLPTGLGLKCHSHAPKLQLRTASNRHRHVRVDLRAVDASIVRTVEVGQRPLPIVVVEAGVLAADTAALAAIGREIDLGENTADRVFAADDDLALVGW